MDDVLHQADTDMASVSVKKEEGGKEGEEMEKKKEETHVQGCVSR